MSQAPVEADPLFQLLTDALRAGPGSPEWHQAVAKVREGGVSPSEHADEFRVLVAVREHLESGRDWRTVRAGPGFTRKLFDRLDEEDHGGRRRGLPAATLIALLGGLVIVGVLAVVAWQLIPHGTTGGDRTVKPNIQELEQAYFPTEVAAATFDAAGGTGPAPALPPMWQSVGKLDLEVAKPGLRPAPGGPTDVGGALLAPDTLPADEPFEVDVKLQLGRPAEDVIVQAFVSADADFSPDKATSGNEIVWSLRGPQQQVILGQTPQKEAPRPAPPPAGDKPQTLTVRILVSKDAAVVQTDGQPLWSGTHGLPANPRRVGIRFLRAGPKAADKGHEPAAVQSIRILKK